MMHWRKWLRKPATNEAARAKALPAGVNEVITKALSAAGLLKRSSRETEQTESKPRARASSPADGKQFFWDACGDAPNLLDYKVYLPSNYSTSAPAMPLVVMLHGCTQDPDDFAIGTRMNVLAEQQGFIIAYPQQPVGANSSKCWNWFRPDDQQRDRGEPGRIAKMVRELVARYRIDPRRVYVAGMSAGAAMAVIMARSYPDIFSAVAVHSGLPYRSANNVVSALAVMKSARASDAFLREHACNTCRVPMIVFHGDHDRTVDHTNADALVQQAVADWPGSEPLSTATTARSTEGGRVCDRIIYRTPAGETAIEYWTVHGGEHRWSGGDPHGSHTDASGPDASTHMWRFLRSHSQGES